MRVLRFIDPSWLFASVLLALVSASSVRAAEMRQPANGQEATAAVTVVDNGGSWTLDNGIVKATINKDNGVMMSLIYRGFDTGARGVWEHTPQGAPQLTNTITIDPASNGGERAEISIKGVTGGTHMLTPSAPGGGTLCDVELRYALGRGDSGVYVYAVFTHPAAYGAAGTGAESRFITSLSKTFDWITVDKDRNMLECSPSDWGTGVVVHAKEQRILDKGVYKNSVEHKYSYSGMQYRTPAYGWSSTKEHVGVWFINPTVEFLSGGPERIDLDAHLGANDDPPPIILDYWHSGHYAGGTRTNLAAGEEWTKVVGPILVYVNHLDKPKATTQAELDTLKATEGNPTVPASWHDNANALWQDALAQAKKENSKWPYAWVKGVDYTPAEQRGTVSGRLVLNDPLAPKGSKTQTRLPHLTVGLTHPDANGVSWIHEAKYYQFFTDGAEDGRFTIAKVRPGKYTLHAFADGVLGEFEQADITVEPGKSVDLGKLGWKPVRYGKQLWEIGYPNRDSEEFFKGDGSNSWLWGWNLRYAMLFPNDLTYTVGKSDWHKDWFFEEVPHATSMAFLNPAAKDPANQRFGWVKAESKDQYPETDQRGPWAVYGKGRETVWKIRFHLDKPSQGVAAFRVALAGVDGMRQLAVAVNGKSAGAVGDGSDADNAQLRATNAIRYNTDKGMWQERTLKFDASLLNQGDNEMTLTVPAGDLQSGVVWDYLRLELDESAKPAGASAAQAGQ